MWEVVVFPLLLLAKWILYTVKLLAVVKRGHSEGKLPWAPGAPHCPPPPQSPACPPSLPSHCWFTQRPATSVSDLARFVSVVSWDTFFNLSVKFSLTLKVWFKLSPSFEDFGNLHSEWELLSSCSYGIF